jgi:dynein heavy chain
MCVGPTGTGKSLAIGDKLVRNMPKDFIPEFITFSAKTSANQTQDLIDGKLDKRSVSCVFVNLFCCYFGEMKSILL